MAQLLLVKRDPTDGRLYVLCHRRGKGIREPFHWGIPGGAFEREEKYYLAANDCTSELMSGICRRAAIRETIEECGGGDHAVLQPEPSVALPAVQAGGKICLKEAVYPNVLLPPALLNIAGNNMRSCREMRIPYGSLKNKHTTVVVYVMHRVDDAAFFADWSPRAMKQFRGEIDEGYTTDGCVYGQKWVDLEYMLTHPDRPVEGSTMPLCEFLVNMAVNTSAELVHHIHELILLQEAPIDDSDLTLESLVLENRRPPGEWRDVACADAANNSSNILTTL